MSLPYQNPVPCRRCAWCRQWLPLDELTECGWLGEHAIAWECDACRREAADKALASSADDVGF